MKRLEKVEQMAENREFVSLEAGFLPRHSHRNSERTTEMNGKTERMREGELMNAFKTVLHVLVALLEFLIS